MIIIFYLFMQLTVMRNVVKCIASTLRRLTTKTVGRLKLLVEQNVSLCLFKKLKTLDVNIFVLFSFLFQPIHLQKMTFFHWTIGKSSKCDSKVFIWPSILIIE